MANGSVNISIDAHFPISDTCVLMSDIAILALLRGCGPDVYFQVYLEGLMALTGEIYIRSGADISLAIGTWHGGHS